MISWKKEETLQMKRMVTAMNEGYPSDRTNQEEGKQLSDGDEIMTKDGVTISKFSKEAMHGPGKGRLR